jgi:hypothetical protein
MTDNLDHAARLLGEAERMIQSAAEYLAREAKVSDAVIGAVRLLADFCEEPGGMQRDRAMFVAMARDVLADIPEELYCESDELPAALAAYGKEAK